ncbi:MAG TPA: RagB/SusD family nutrient uptake outer membrane protein [Chitinophagaceae bacterium]|nr:RagB/SusD family nutrient uptake outer membrane protein [Chitinophagaceae bacterium]
MKHIKYSLVLLLVILLGFSACKKDLDVQNPNNPTLTDALTESGIVSLAQGAVYLNGFNLVFNAGLNQLGSGFTYTVYGYQELLADILSASASNQNINVINLPEYVILDNGTKVSSGSTQRSTIRITNTRSNRSSNSLYYEWAFMYSLNNALNNVLDVLPNVKFTGDAASKRKTIEAWAYWWKGYAYSRIGSMYYAGLINNTTNKSNADYVTHDAIIVEANKNLDLATAALNSVTNAGDYTTILGQLIPAFIQVGKGGVLTQTMWKNTINTMKGRNLLVNKRVSAMTAADWNTILTLTANGVTPTDNVFTVRTTSDNGILSTGANVVAISTGPTSTFRISERLIQEYKTGDQRLTNNFKLANSPRLDQTGGITFSTRYFLLNGDPAVSAANQSPRLPGVILYSNSSPGQQEIYVGPTYEENALMRAEALIYTNQINAGLALIDAVRAYQGAGIAAVANTGLTLAQAIVELRRERRVALVFRGVSFYDYRRWGITDDVSKGGGRTGAVVLTTANVLNTNSTINYNFLDYWDVPQDETELNPPSAGSAPVVNPN